MSSRAESSKGLDSKEGRVNEADHDQSSFVLGSMTIKKTCFKGVSQLRLMSIIQSLSCCKMRATKLLRISSKTTSSRTRVPVVCRVRQCAAEAARVNAKPRWSGLELIDSRNEKRFSFRLNTFFSAVTAFASRLNRCQSLRAVSRTRRRKRGENSRIKRSAPLRESIECMRFSTSAGH